MTQPAALPPDHRALLELPATLENLNAKMNHLIVRTEVGIKSSDRAEATAERARVLAEASRDAARNAGTIAVKAVQGVDALPKRQRLAAVAAGSVLGGAAVSLVVWLILIAAGASSLTSCVGR